MALPLIPVIAGGISTVAGWFATGGAISMWFAWLGAKFTAKTTIVAIQIATILVLFASRVAFLLGVLEVGRLTFNYINDFLGRISDFFSGDAILSLAFDVMRSIGLLDAFIDAFAIFNILFMAILLAWLSKFAFHVAKVTSDEFFKLGMLLQA